ncbi:hypothetical protein MYM_0180 [Mesomycoplasma hyorhinis GDL-1]|uniref:Uncharacterized protein n=1 Tax=Mesomycoplasma hyorhinis (strain MCLD) TaxID=936139 RepID=A0ABM5M5P0_MESHM|nr:hypothetical protein SRH_01140 [Mesomycoplasma hyorhinis MCLD]AEX13975.1 hypothetical protein MYM_0180 [Mesomycoplasma hyorhinis GDL-1]AHA40943.1 hypothetical protein Q453_0192 [Mesomycoplasma hyorhinis DBS 1050]
MLIKNIRKSRFLSLKINLGNIFIEQISQLLLHFNLIFLKKYTNNIGRVLLNLVKNN